MLADPIIVGHEKASSGCDGGCIAGAVIGSIVGALLLLGLFFLWRRNKDRDASVAKHARHQKSITPVRGFKLTEAQRESMSSISNGSGSNASMPVQPDYTKNAV